MKDRGGVGSFRLGFWKLTEKRNGAIKGICPLCEDEKEIQIL
jgi:hypothetical protein